MTFQRDDLSKANLIASGLFGDGAAAVIVAGAEKPGVALAAPRSRDRPEPAVLGSRSVFYPDSEDIMGWDISENGFRIVLSPRLPELIRNNLAADVDAFLGEHRLRRRDIGTWIIHTGGPKILESIQQTLELRDGDLERSWRCLSEVGNLSSASVLLVLEDCIVNEPPAPGTLGVLLAMGPGFCAEMILLRW